LSVRRTAFWAAFAVGCLVVAALAAVDLLARVPIGSVLGRALLGTGLAALLAAAASSIVGRALSRRLAASPPPPTPTRGRRRPCRCRPLLRTRRSPACSGRSRA
jgi:hypothetical protein